MASRVPLITILKQAGFKGNALRTAWALAMRESGGNPQAFNGNTGTGDRSYGLFQINMLGSLGPARMRQYGLKSEQDLFNPAVNAKVAYRMSQGGRDFGAWGIGQNAYKHDPGQIATFQKYYDEFPAGNQNPSVTVGGPQRGSQGPLRASGTTIPGMPPFSAGFAQPIPTGEVQPEKIGLPQPGTMPTDAPLGAIPNNFKITLVHGDGLPPLKVAAPPGSLPHEDPHVENVVQIARHYLGSPYVFGANGPKRFDCSGLVQFTYRQVGIKLPRTTWQQMKVGKQVSVNALKAGDILFFNHGEHEMMYIGGGRAIEAPHTGDVVKIVPVDPSSVYMARRVL